MKNKFITKKTKKLKKWKIFFLFFMFLLGLYASYKNFEKSNLKITDKDLVDLVIDNSFSEEETLIETVINKTLQLSNPLKLLNKDYNKYINSKVVEKEQKVSTKDYQTPLIYLYNSHQTEEYAPSTYAEFSINPTVIMNNYILEDIFNKNGYQTIVEEEEIKKILTENNWKYANSYKASRILLEKSILKYPTLEYFIDIHRDSLKRERTTINIRDKDYAKVMFLIGLENPNYQANLELTEKINNKLNELYPGLSKGILKKGGPGVNGIYNQDFSKNTILIEIGGYENTTIEVLNTSIAFSECFMEVLNEKDS